jgi:RND family efflux transporter MFP subunit
MGDKQVDSRRGWAIGVSLIVLFLPACAVSFGQSVEAITRPSADVALSFVRAGQVAEVLVKEGDAVEAGQLLARQDDTAEQIQLAQLKAEAEDTVRVEAAEAQLAQKREDLKKLEWAQKEGAATEWEVAHARLEVRIGELSLELARFEREQAGRKFEEAKAQLERMRLCSPVAGLVEEVKVEPGEAAEPMAAVIRVVKIDPLWVEVPAPLVQGRRLRAGQAAAVAFPGEEISVSGKVVYMAAVADAASDTLSVRVEVPNPSGRPAGERVEVTFEPAESAHTEAADRPPPVSADTSQTRGE